MHKKKKKEYKPPIYNSYPQATMHHIVAFFIGKWYI